MNLKNKYFVLGMVIVLCAVTITIISSLKDKEDVTPVSGINASSNMDIRPNMVPVYLYFANEDMTALSAETRYIPIEEASKSVANLATVIVNELIEGPSKTSELCSVIPEDTELIDTIEVEKDKAIVNFNVSFVDNHPGGKENEQMTIYSIVNSLTELKDINSVEFRIDGELREEYLGNYKFDNPFPRTVSLIKDN